MKNLFKKGYYTLPESIQTPIWVARRRSQMPADPFEIRYINPKYVDYLTVAAENVPKVHDDFHYPDLTTTQFQYGRFPDSYAGKVLNGEWDKRTIQIKDCVIFDSIQDRFVNNVAWEKTSYFSRLVDFIEQGNTHRGYSSPEDLLEKWFPQIDELYSSIQNDGFKSANQLHTGRNKYDEHVSVNVGRGGNLMLNDGKHRFSIARILNIKKIPVRLLVRHEDNRRTNE